MNQSAKYHFNQHDLELVGRILVYTLIGGLLTNVTQIAGNFSYGVYTPAVMMVISVVSSAIGQWYRGVPCSCADIPALTPSQTPAAGEIVPPTE